MSRTTYKTAPKAGLYTRLSVDDGITDKESNSITSQKQMLMQYAQYHGIEVAEIYVEMKIAYLIQRVRTENLENSRNKGFRYISVTESL